jgi:adenylate kinase
MKFVIFGAPGAGKGTYSRRLQEQLGIAAISTGDIFREAVKAETDLGKKVKGYLDSGGLVPDDVVLEVLKERLNQPDAQKGFILDGYPRTLKQANDLEGVTKIDAVINLNVPEWVIVERLSSRRQCKKCGAIYNVRFLKPKVEGICDTCDGELFQRDDDKADVIKERLKVYEENTKPLLEFFKEKGVTMVTVICNDVDVPPEIMVDKILKALKEKGLI